VFKPPESATVIVLLIFAAALAACTPSQDDAMRSPSPTAARGAKSTTTSPVRTDTADDQRAALGPIPEPVSAAENPLPLAPIDSAAEAVGRRTLSTAFVRVGPDGRLTVGLRDGRTVLLRNVVMRRKDYCGTRLDGSKAGGEYCGRYAEIAAARPGGGEAPAEPDLVAPNPLSPGTRK
jgi:hypothetical protein